MFKPAHQSHFSLTLEGLAQDLKVLEFSGREAVSQPYRFELEPVSERPDLDRKAWIIAQVLEAHGIQANAYCFELGPTVYPERDYCVQYETVPDFIQRLYATYPQANAALDHISGGKNSCSNPHISSPYSQYWRLPPAPGITGSTTSNTVPWATRK